ncbi:CU044_2847 family protein [Argonema antarcticum]|uniref:CU044_2847 family protein n=1 Tax=Argonema antarcticum TaxID=2942763 RepID=UPI002013590F|nr:CU044_2847 family protein [Argonema antarcticum]MCL1475133.1 hypothetical protein [Argonema antarcticum A004/B2]
MDKLTPIELEDGTIIYIEATEDVDTSNINTQGNESEERGRTARGGVTDQQARMMQNFQAIESTIRTYTNHTLSAFKSVTTGNITKVTLEFGIKIGGEMGIPYITKGTAESNLKIKVECDFRKSETSVNSDSDDD